MHIISCYEVTKKYHTNAGQLFDIMGNYFSNSIHIRIRYNTKDSQIFQNQVKSCLYKAKFLKWKTTNYKAPPTHCNYICRFAASGSKTASSVYQRSHQPYQTRSHYFHVITSRGVKVLQKCASQNQTVARHNRLASNDIKLLIMYWVNGVQKSFRGTKYNC
jgi:hypothetical protein